MVLNYILVECPWTYPSWDIHGGRNTDSHTDGYSLGPFFPSLKLTILGYFCYFCAVCCLIHVLYLSSLRVWTFANWNIVCCCCNENSCYFCDFCGPLGDLLYLCSFIFLRYFCKICRHLEGLLLVWWLKARIYTERQKHQTLHGCCLGHVSQFYLFRICSNCSVKFLNNLLWWVPCDENPLFLPFFDENHIKGM